MAEGSRLYAAKAYGDASEKYADACSEHNSILGEEDPDLLLMYGKALFQNAVSNSEVFGGAPASGEKSQTAAEIDVEGEDDEEEEECGNFQFHAGSSFEDDASAANDEESGSDHEKQQEEEEEEEQGNEQDGAGDEPTDFEVAWEILDLARCLFEDRLASLIKPGDLCVPYIKDDSDDQSEYVRTLQKVSDTYDLLGELSLEAENFPEAAEDLAHCLEVRSKLYDPKLSPLVSESHYKLSLALEYCVNDPDARKKAVEHMRLAIDSVKLRNSHEKKALVKAENDALLRDLQVRYDELKKDPEEEFSREKLEIMQGLLGAATKKPSTNDLTASIKKKDAVNDLSASVKRKDAVNDLSANIKRKKSNPK